MTPRAAAGWYVDPGVPGQLRWWDGTDWADDTVAPTTKAQAPATPTRTGTVWIWLAIVGTTLPLATGALLGPLPTGRFVGALVAGPAFAPGAGALALVGLAGIVLVNALLVAASIVCCLLDHRALRRRGVPDPFGWGWAWLAFAATLGVYVVGRTVVVVRRTGRGYAPLVGWGILTLVGCVVLAVWLTGFSESLWTAVTTVP